VIQKADLSLIASIAGVWEPSARDWWVFWRLCSVLSMECSGRGCGGWLVSVCAQRKESKTVASELL
jgi:hypothetical protein